MKQIGTKTMRTDYSHDLADQLLSLKNYVAVDNGGGGGGKNDVVPGTGK